MHPIFVPPKAKQRQLKQFFFDWKKQADEAKLRNLQQFRKALGLKPAPLQEEQKVLKNPPVEAYPVGRKSHHSSYKLAARLTKMGYKELGNGAFGAVFGHPKSDKVLKICHRIDCWLDYVKWADEKGYLGTFAPMVYKYKYFPKGDYCVALMERLESTLSHTKKEHDAKAIHSLVNMSEYNPLAQTLLDLAVPGLPLFIKEVTSTFKGRLDFHGGNFMVRKDKSFVVTDPIYGEPKTDYKKTWVPKTLTKSLAMAA